MSFDFRFEDSHILDMTDLLIVGAGVLGMMVARKWLALYPGAKVTLKYRSYNKERADTLGGEGFNVICKEKGEDFKAPLVIFCAPPTGNTDYDEDIKLCSQNHWETSEKEKSAFIFTSAGSVYAENKGDVVDEVEMGEDFWDFIAFLRWCGWIRDEAKY